MITSAGKRNPTNADRGADQTDDRAAWFTGQACLIFPTANATEPPLATPCAVSRPPGDTRPCWRGSCLVDAISAVKRRRRPPRRRRLLPWLAETRWCGVGRRCACARAGLVGQVPCSRTIAGAVRTKRLTARHA